MLPSYIHRRPAAYPYYYVEPTKTAYLPHTKKYTGERSLLELEKIAPIGPSPTFLQVADLTKMAPLWLNITVDIHNDVVIGKDWGWLKQNYGFALAEYLAGIGRVSLHLKLMAQPPWDDKLLDFYLLHYQHSQDFEVDGRYAAGKRGYWHFSKRDYQTEIPEQAIPLPPSGCVHETSVRLIELLNDATHAIPCWPEYSDTKRAHVKDALDICRRVRFETVERDTVDRFPGNV
jgi:hydroxyproline O-arabinosyltransferase